MASQECANVRSAHDIFVSSCEQILAPPPVSGETVGMTVPFALPGFDLDRFVRDTLAEDLGEGLPGGGHDVTSESVIPAGARFAGVMDSRDAIVVAGLPVAEAFFRALDRKSTRLNSSH